MYGKLIFEVAAIHLDAKASPGTISESVLAFFRWKKPNTVPGIAPGGVLPPRLKRTASKMNFPCKRHAIFRKTRDRMRSEIVTQNGLQLPQEIEPGLPKKIKGTLLILAQPSKSHFQRDRYVFRKSACRPHGKLIFEVAAIHLDAKASPGAISESVLAFFRWKKTNTVP